MKKFFEIWLIGMLLTLVIGGVIGLAGGLMAGIAYVSHLLYNWHSWTIWAVGFFILSGFMGVLYAMDHDGY